MRVSLAHFPLANENHYQVAALGDGRVFLILLVYPCFAFSALDKPLLPLLLPWCVDSARSYQENGSGFCLLANETGQTSRMDRT